MAKMQLSEESTTLLNRIAEQMDVSKDWTTMIESNKFVTLKEALTTQDASILIPRVVTGMMREAAEPNYIGSGMLQKVRLTDGRSIEFPSMGAMRAHDIGESQSYLEETIDFQLHRTQEVKVGKSGMIVRVTQEMIDDSQWDVVGLLLKRAGEAMSRLKEEKIFNQFSLHGHQVFNNHLREQYPQAGTTGMDINGNQNNTMSTEDMIDLFIALMSNGCNATDILLHPLSWSVFFKNDIMQSLTHGALGGSQITNLQIKPETVSGRIPFAVNLTFSPFVPFNQDTKEFDSYVVDRNKIGILLEKDALSTEQFNNPERDIQSIKVKERYGIGILDEGKAVATARNLAFERSYPTPERVKIVS